MVRSCPLVKVVWFLNRTKARTPPMFWSVFVMGGQTVKTSNALGQCLKRKSLSDLLELWIQDNHCYCSTQRPIDSFCLTIAFTKHSGIMVVMRRRRRSLRFTLGETWSRRCIQKVMRRQKKNTMMMMKIFKIRLS